MFWNKVKESKDYWTGRSIVLFKRFRLLTESDKTDIFEDSKKLNNKLNLILDHLKLEYVPEKSVTEKARLRQNRNWSGVISIPGSAGTGGDNWPIDTTTSNIKTTTVTIPSKRVRKAVKKRKKK